MNVLPSAEQSIDALGLIAIGGLASAALGGLLGWGVTAGVGHLLRVIETEWGNGGRGSRVPSGASRLGFQFAAIVAGIGLFVWEVLLGGLDPAAAAGSTEAALGSGWMAEWPRAAAHLVLFAFMAAAVWIDFEYRLIPDAITVPGALLGMLCVTLCPDLLLPVGWEQPRSYAPPLVVADVLGAFGPLRGTAGSAWLAPAPSAWGLGALAGAFTAWWVVCTAPGAARAAWRDPRTWILPVGLVALTLVWVAGSRDAAMIHFRAAEASLLGAVISGGIVWLIREGASRALGREAMGLGDVTLMAMVGAWCGWQHGVLTFFAAAFIGLAQGLVTWLWRRDNELPYGPSLCLAACLVILAWRTVWDRVGIHFEEPLLLFGAVAGVIILTAVSLAGWARLRR